MKGSLSSHRAFHASAGMASTRSMTSTSMAGVVVFLVSLGLVTAV
jgi:hypothetical protein